MTAFGLLVLTWIGLAGVARFHFDMYWGRAFRMSLFAIFVGWFVGYVIFPLATA